MLSIDQLEVELDAEAGLVRAIDGLSIAIERGETFALVGESGCGKSMTALALMRLLPENGRVAHGRIALEGTELLALPERRMRAVRGGRIGMIFQEPGTSLNPVMRVGAQIVEAIRTHTELRGRAARAKAIEWLGRVGIPEPERRIDDYPFRLSGGQKQRVMIAIALAAEPDFLIADEPTTALDVTIQAQILELLKRLQQEQGMGLLLITHDLAVVSGMAHTVALMYAGQIVEVAAAAEFFAAPKHPYARLLLRALPEAVEPGQRLAAITGSVPGLGQTFVGCRFAPRCDRVFDACHRVAPALYPAGAAVARCLLWAEPPGGAAPGTPGSAATGISHVEPATFAPIERTSPGAPLLQVIDLTVRFASSGGRLRRSSAPARPVVDGVSFDVARGETVALVGESGCGKTTTGKAIVQLLRSQALVSGQALLDGRDLFRLDGDALRAARREVQIVFQDPFASLDPRMRVFDILLQGPRALRPEDDESARRKAVEQMADLVGIGGAALQRYPHEFSGGQRQRIAIARALVLRPRLLICDEPTSALDVSVQAQILNLLRDLQRELQVAYVLITHNLGVVAHSADRVVVMRQGRVEEVGSVADVLARPSARYTRELLDAVPRLQARS